MNKNGQDADEVDASKVFMIINKKDDPRQGKEKKPEKYLLAEGFNDRFHECKDNYWNSDDRDYYEILL